MANKLAVCLIAAMGLGSLGSALPSLAQLPQLPPAPPAPPASSPSSPVPPTPAVPSAPETSSPETSSPDPSSPSEFTNPAYIRPQATCPQDFTALSALLVRDIPGYTNRILQSSVADIPTAYRPAYVITANQPERTPLDVRDLVYTTRTDSGESMQQLFFTTLERQYSALEASSLSHFHWLFLAPGDEGWEMVFMFSAIDAENEVMLPPRDSSQGSVGQAVRRWLRDCRVNAVLVE